MFQGDQYLIPVYITAQGTYLDLSNISKVEITIHNVTKEYPGEVSYDPSSGAFLFPMTQKESFSMPSKKRLYAQSRIYYNNDTVFGTDPIDFFIGESLSKEELHK